MKNIWKKFGQIVKNSRKFVKKMIRIWKNLDNFDKLRKFLKNWKELTENRINYEKIDKNWKKIGKFLDKFGKNRIFQKNQEKFA